ncbi:non-ribosomal peptide synthetase [Streptomyces sp. ISL-86]|uniref:non-ribosomal peptide synthetase n=1 Tax=Streptomyces sp. ISL-86 TaxID=2819187 RepID=UPI001BE599AF|nr:non-ribosomal peptide synthetase [Streptomyces sp. ISL-86]MBT2458190.1 amino acid adenylation domain-containing protein [Streptomyces sp. ISL-86]
MNPFDDPDAACLVLVNDDEQQSLWPADVPIPPGWRPVFDGLMSACLDFVEREWTDDRPRRLGSVPDSEAAKSPCLPDLFEAQAARTPQAVAVRHERAHGLAELTYAELAARVDRLAWELRRRGIGPESIVAVALPSGTAFVVAVLAVTKAGGAYLPLDLDYPALRLEFMLADAAPAMTIVPPGDAGAAIAGPTLVLDDTGTATATGEPLTQRSFTDSDRTVPLHPDHPAYLIYTSGSTGRPKAVTVTHRGLPDLCRQFTMAADPRPGSRVLQQSSPSFDASVLELLLALAHGATLVIPRSRHDDLADVFVRLAVTHSFVTPAALAAITPPEGEVPIPGGVLEVLIAGGEVLSPALVRQWAPGRKFYNIYGPTETTVCVTMSEPLLPADEPTPIGSTILGTRVHVLDERLQPVPDGEIGELYAAGPGVARGYHGRPGLTASRFVACPFPDPADPSGHVRTGTRMYRSGDLVRRRADGGVDYVGRADQQIKIRGFRTELGEIEAVVAAHPAVVQCAVLARPVRDEEEDTSSAQLRLVAFIVALPGPKTDQAELRAHVERQLPAHMVPNAWVFLDRLPMTSNGKLDRTALAAQPIPEHRPAPSAQPRTETERMLAELFSQTLHHERVGVDDNFFDLGGNSLLAARMTNRIRAAADAEIGVQAIFGSPTVAGLARLIDAGPSSTLPPLVPMPRPRRVPLSSAQARLWFLHRLDGPNAAYNIPLVWQLTGPVDTSALADALADVLARHESLRTVFGEYDGIPFQRVLDPDDLAPCLTVEQVAESDLATAVDDACRFCFDLTVDVPVRSWLFRTESTAPTATLVLLVHHIAADEWSMRPLLRDLSEAYAARRAGAVPAWSELPVQYGDYSLWQRRLLAGRDGTRHPLMQADLDFWTAALADAPADAVVPADHPRSADEDRHIGARVTFAVGADVRRNLFELARACGATGFAPLHAAVSVLLRDFGAGTDVPIGVPIAGRDAAELEDVVGFFVNTVILRADVSGDPTFRQLVTQLARRDVDAFAHGRIPFDHVVDSLNLRRDLGRSAGFQVMIGFNQGPPDRLTLAGTDCVVVPVDTGTTKFDLTITFADTSAEHGPTGLSGVIEYDRHLFEASTVEALAAHLVVLLGEGAAQPDVPMGSAQHTRARSPRGETEALLAELFADSLRRPDVEIGIDDDFFDLGGDRLAVARLANRIRTMMDVEFGVDDLRRMPTIATIAAWLDHMDETTQTHPGASADLP